MPIVPNTVDLANWVLYDTNTAAQATTSAVLYQFFTTPQSATKTKVSTNLTMPQMLEAPQWFNCQTIGFEFVAPMFYLDAQAILSSYYFEFWVGQKVYAEGPLDCAQSGYGLFLSGSTGTATAPVLGNFASTNGIPEGMPSFSLVLPAGITDGSGNPLPGANGINGVSILQNQSFHVDLKAATGVALTATASGGFGMTIRCYLTGILSRGAQ